MTYYAGHEFFQTEKPSSLGEKEFFTVTVVSSKELSDLSLPGTLDKKLFFEIKERFCSAEVHPHCFVGSFSIPKKDANLEKLRFLYMLHENGVVFVDDTGTAERHITAISKKRVYKKPSIGFFFHDFLESLIADDLQYILKLEDSIAKMEDAVLTDRLENFNRKMIAFRKEITAFAHYYIQLDSVAAELFEDGADILDEEEKNLFHLFSDRLERLRGEMQVLREYSMQIREVYQAQVDIRQNRVMRVLTVVTTVFLPLTLIVGWYGMNFTNMHELEWKYGYFAVSVICLLIVILLLWFFKKKKYF